MTNKEYTDALGTIALSSAMKCMNLIDEVEKERRPEVVSALAELLNAAQTLYRD